MTQIPHNLDAVLEEARKLWPAESMSFNYTHPYGWYVSLHAHGTCVHGKSEPRSATASFENALKQAVEQWPDDLTAARNAAREAQERADIAAKHLADMESAS